MNAHVTMTVADTGAVLHALQQLYPRREAARLYKECGGSAARVLEIARVRNGRQWRRLQAAESLYQRALLERAAQGPAMQSPVAVREYLVRMLATLTHEVFCVLFLDNRHRLIAMREIFRGTIDGSSVHPREVVKEALAQNAAAVVLAHNHPSGVSEPSQADELITARLKEALGLLDIRVLDHVIVGGERCMSFAERGLI